MVTALATCPKITSPGAQADFTKPITISWDSQGIEVKRYWLCVGEKSEKNDKEEVLQGWDIFSGDVGTSEKHAIDVSGKGLKALCILLICTVEDGTAEDDLETKLERTFDADQITVEAL